MTTMTTEDQILWLHTVEDRLWVAGGQDTPRNVGDEGSIDQLLTGTRTVRALGTKQNAGLLIRLREQYADRCSVEIASPRVCEDMAELQNPYTAVLRMRQCHTPASRGGWHQFSRVDHASYTVASLMDSPTDWSPQIEEAIMRHPLIPYMSFIPTMNYRALAYVIGTVRDPRWHTSVDGRMTPFKRVLGIHTHKLVREVIGGVRNSVRHCRCASMIDCWRGKVHISELRDPPHFLQRIARSEADQGRGVLKATQAFAAYLYWTWQQVIADHSHSGQEMDMFVPEYLLTPAESDALRAHVED